MRGASPTRSCGPTAWPRPASCFLAKTAAEELGPLGIRVNAVAPGIIDDELMSFITAGGPLLDHYLSQMPLGRVGTVEDVAAAVRYLVGPESSWVTGETHQRRRRPSPAPGRRLLPPLRELGTKPPIFLAEPPCTRLSEMITVMVMILVKRTARNVLPALAGLALAAALPAALAGPAAAAPAPVRVVAAENFWGNITAQIGGHDVAVTSLITNPNADPHLFETDAQDAADLARAQVVVENGAGYDSWMRSLLAADSGHRTVVTAATVLHVTGSDPNPHLWYDIPKVPAVAAAIAAALTKAAPADTASFKANLATFDASLAPLNATLATIKTHFHGVGVAYTERVPGYALAAAGLAVKTPPGFARAIEDGVDPGPADTVAMQQLIDDHDVNVLLYNSQTVTPVTTQIRTLARQHGIPVVGVSETMPAGVATYQQWQQRQLSALLHALEHSRSP